MRAIHMPNTFSYGKGQELTQISWIPRKKLETSGQLVRVNGGNFSYNRIARDTVDKCEKHLQKKLPLRETFQHEINRV